MKISVRLSITFSVKVVMKGMHLWVILLLLSVQIMLVFHVHVIFYEWELRCNVLIECNYWIFNYYK